MTRPPLAKTFACLLSIAFVSPLSLTISALAADRAGESEGLSSGTVEREIMRRRDYINRGTKALEIGDRAMKDKDYEKAFAQYRLACDLIPNSPNSGRLYSHAVNGLCDAGVALAEQRIAEGRYADAGNLLNTVLDERYDPNCKRARVLLARIEQPDYYNKTINPKFRANVEQVKQYLVDARGYLDTGRYDLAYKRCEQILNLDPYNTGARKLQEEINRKRETYAIEGYNQTRSYAIWQTAKAWDRPVRRFGDKQGTVITQDPVQANLTQVLQRKLERIIIPKLELRDATIREAIEFLKQKSSTLDTAETDPSKRGVNIVLKLENAGGIAAPMEAVPAVPAAPLIPGLEPLPGAPAAGAAPAAAAPIGGMSAADTRITVQLSNIPLGEALRYVTGLANLKYKVEQYAVSVVPASTQTESLITKEWKVPPGFLAGQPAVAGGDPLGAPVAGGGGGGIGDASKGGTGIVKRLEAKDFLISSGVQFPPGASAIFLPSTSKLIVKNTQENIELIDAIVDSAIQGGPVLIEIESKFVEINQNNLKELSFDWLLGQANAPGNGRVFASGGTTGTAPGLVPADYPFNNQNGTPVGGFPVTSGLRSGNLAISPNAIDALLFGVAGSSALSPAVGAIAGVFTDPQFQLVIRALNQKKGIDLLSAPRVTTKSANKAIIEIIREFRYPTEFEPPQIPQNFGNQNGNGGGGTGVTINLPGSFPVTPTTPTGFETRNTGVTLEVDPLVGPDNYTIDMTLIPQVVEFEGFINYGSPITSTSINILTGQPVTNIITPNVINQPIFSTRKVSTSVSVFDGQTVVLGGLIREDVQKTEDKIPFLGDIPLLGRLFRSSVEQHLKRNLVIFVTARLINPGGEPIHPDEETEEIVETLPVPQLAMPAPELPLMPK